MIAKVSEIIEKAKSFNKTIAIAAAADETVLGAAKKAKEIGIADFCLCGEARKIEAILEEIGASSLGFKIFDCPDVVSAAKKAAELVTEGTAHTVMKGSIKTGTLLKVLLSDEYNFKTGKTMSLNAVFEIPGFDRLLILTDPGMVITPTLQQKVDLIKNAIQAANALGNEMPKVGIIGAVEVVNPKMPNTMDAALLSKMADRGQIKGAVVDGPFALDNVISLESAEHKGIVSPVAGKADIIIAPNIEAGNMLYKALVFLAKAQLATSILGGSVPIILTSRSDSEETKLNSIAFNVLLSEVVR
ncbi:MAG TPA: bifunctional enoyl-CoA hydratase/phosphate acetyltransferase [Thermotogota bacterium]|nr:bifunctional enoyl-CoA hydratase/phosphate acetyltransferase [Thermotogota bacterium]HPR95076.1 bifunctional enoyl-CoA hydratase/phosphate acetyltransferase [Thermotogota bacterium]